MPSTQSHRRGPTRRSPGSLAGPVKRASFRHLFYETLEDRRLLAGVSGHVALTPEIESIPHFDVAPPAEGEGADIDGATCGGSYARITDVAPLPYSLSNVFIELSPDSQTLYVPTHRDTYNGYLYAFDANTLDVKGSLYTTYDPLGIAVSPDGSIGYVTNTVNGYYATRFDPETMEALGHVRTGTDAAGIVFTPDGSRVYAVNNWSSYLTIIDPQSNQSIGTVPGITPGAEDLAITPDGRYLYVAGREGNIFKVSTETNTVVSTISVSFGGRGARELVVSPDGQSLYVAGTLSQSLHVFSTASDAEVARVDFGAVAPGLALSPDGQLLLATLPEERQIKLLSATTLEILDTLHVEGRPLGVVFGSDGQRAYAKVADPNSVIAIEVLPGACQPTGWRFWHSDPTGSNFQPAGSSVPTDRQLNLEQTLGSSWGFSLTGDVDGDGWSELVRVEGTGLSIFDHLGQLQTAQTLPFSGALSILDDVDGDGIVDIGIGGRDGSGTIYCWFYNGQGQLIQTVARPAGYQGHLRPAGVIAPGVVLASAWATGHDPRGLFAYDIATGQEVWHYDFGRSEAGLTSLADIDGDGRLEATVAWVTVHNGNSANGTIDGDLYLTITDDDGTNLLTQIYPSPSNGLAYHAFADLDQDGTYEILGIESHDPRYYRGINEVHLYDLDGSTLHTYSGPWNEEWLWAVADIDNDGWENVIVGGHSVLTVLDNQLRELRSIPEDGFVQLAADLTGDGYAEIVTMNSSGLLRVYDYELNLLDSIQVAGNVGRGPVMADDVDGDGVVELVVRSSVGSHVVAFREPSAVSPPEATADAYDMYGETLAVGGDGVLANDTDANGDSLTARLVDPPSEGHVTLNTDGSFTYEIGPEFDGVDTFTYVANDGHLDSEPATVTITHMLYVRNTHDSGDGSLRWTMENANQHPGRDTIRFAIPGAGVQTIRPLSELPTVTDPVVLDAYLRGDPQAGVRVARWQIHRHQHGVSGRRPDSATGGHRTD